MQAVGHFNAGREAPYAGDTPLRETGADSLATELKRATEFRRMNLFKRSNGEIGWWGIPDGMLCYVECFGRCCLRSSLAP